MVDVRGDDLRPPHGTTPAGSMYMQVIIRGETIHRNYGASRFSGHDSVHDFFSPSFDTVWFTQVQTKVVN